MHTKFLPVSWQELLQRPKVRVLFVMMAVFGVLIGGIVLWKIQPYLPAINALLHVNDVPVVKYQHAEILTSKGSITITFNKDTPRNAANFISLVESGFYNGTRIHRSVPELLIQGGDPLTKYADATAEWGNGGPGYTIQDEALSKYHMDRGAVAMVNTGKNTNGSQFFIVTGKKAQWLNGKNTIFAYVTDGMNIVDQINQLPVNLMEVPAEKVMITGIRLY